MSGKSSVKLVTKEQWIDFSKKYDSLRHFRMDAEKLCKELITSLKLYYKFSNADFYRYVSFVSVSNLYGADITAKQERAMRDIWMYAAQPHRYSAYACDFRVCHWEFEDIPHLIDAFSLAYENGVDDLILAYLKGVPLDDVLA